jgi:hypothetical protein
VSVLIQLRGDTAAAWTAANPVLAAREPAIETDTGKTKYGDGVTAWTSLAYTTGSGGSTVDASTTVKGIVELATNTETTTGTDTVRATTPAGVKAVADAKSDKVVTTAEVFHNGTTGGGTRPTGYTRVRWINPVGTTYGRPTNMQAGDIWEHDA